MSGQANPTRPPSGRPNAPVRRTNHFDKDNEMPHTTNAQTYDCGDGVPELMLQTNGPATEELAIVDAVADQPATIGAPVAFLALTVVGQLVILLVVLAGGNAVIGAAAGLAMLVCALLVLGAKTLRAAFFDQ